MKLSGLTVSVNYADYLAKGLERWHQGCDRLLVVTDHNDSATIELCLSVPYLEVYRTDAFYRNGAAFNKGAAISEAVEVCNWLDDWQLLFDADMVPTPAWRGIVETSGISEGHIYGASRVFEEQGIAAAGDHWELAGYFQLFHASDQHVQVKPLLDCNWAHAGGYDSEFQSRWPTMRRHRLPLTLVHQGQPGRNWWGRGNDTAMDSMLKERQRIGKLAKCERMEKVAVCSNTSQIP